MRYLILSLSLVFFTVPALASSIHEDYADRTYFTKGKLERIYFDSDGTFTQQLEINWERIPAGNFIKGLWSIKDDKLCLMYTSNLSIQNQQICMDVTRDGFDIIARIGDDENTPPVFHWRRVLKGNYMLKENFLYPEGRSKDEDVINYLLGKVLHINEHEYFYFKSKDIAYIARPEAQEITWTFLNNMLRYYYWDDGELKDDLFFFTLGDEFYDESRSGKLYFYPIEHYIHIEGDGMAVTPFDEFPDKQIFLEYIERASQQP